MDQSFHFSLDFVEHGDLKQFDYDISVMHNILQYFVPLLDVFCFVMKENLFCWINIRWYPMCLFISSHDCPLNLDYEWNWLFEYLSVSARSSLVNCVFRYIFISILVYCWKFSLFTTSSYICYLSAWDRYSSACSADITFITQVHVLEHTSCGIV